MGRLDFIAFAVIRNALTVIRNCLIDVRVKDEIVLVDHSLLEPDGCSCISDAYILELFDGVNTLTAVYNERFGTDFTLYDLPDFRVKSVKHRVKITPEAKSKLFRDNACQTDFGLVPDVFIHPGHDIAAQTTKSVRFTVNSPRSVKSRANRDCSHAPGLRGPRTNSSPRVPLGSLPKNTMTRKLKPNRAVRFLRTIS